MQASHPKMSNATEEVRVKTIVITGGPCSGKTSAMSVLRERLAREHVPAVFVDEAATDLILAGIMPDFKGSMLPFQIKVAALQIARETAARKAAAALGENALVICDRGVCDGKAYVTADEFAQVLDAVGLSAREAAERYDAVFCLESTAKSNTGAYTRENNATRSEDVQTAVQVDDRTIAAWSSHPAFHFLASENTFDEKVEKLIAGILEIAR